MLISSTDTPVKRPYTLRNQIQTLARTGINDEDGQHISINDEGDVADLKFLSKLQGIAISHSRNDIGNTVGPLYDERFSIQSTTMPCKFASFWYGSYELSYDAIE